MQHLVKIRNSLPKRGMEADLIIIVLREFGKYRKGNKGTSQPYFFSLLIKPPYFALITIQNLKLQAPTCLTTSSRFNAPI